MSYRPFRNIGRLALAACAVSFGVASAGAQTTLPNAPNPSRVDVFAGYSYFGTHSEIQPSGLTLLVGKYWSDGQCRLLLQSQFRW